MDPRGRAPKTLPLFPAPARVKVKRIALTLKPETIAALGQVAALQKRPRSAVAADLLDEMAPMLTRLADVLRTAATASAAFPQASVERMDRMVDALAMTAEGAMAELERTVTPPTSQPAARRGRGGGRRH